MRTGAAGCWRKTNRHDRQHKLPIWGTSGQATGTALPWRAVASRPSWVFESPRSPGVPGESGGQFSVPGSPLTPWQDRTPATPLQSPPCFPLRPGNRRTECPLTLTLTPIPRKLPPLLPQRVGVRANVAREMVLFPGKPCAYALYQ